MGWRDHSCIVDVWRKAINCNIGPQTFLQLPVPGCGNQTPLSQLPPSSNCFGESKVFQGIRKFAGSEYIRRESSWLGKMLRQKERFQERCIRSQEKTGPASFRTGTVRNQYVAGNRQ